MRRHGFRPLLALGMAGVLLLAACGRGRLMPKPGIQPLRVLVFYDPSEAPETNPIFPLVTENKAVISVLAPLWYSVRANGTIRDRSQSAIKAWARTNHVPLMPLVNNYGGTSSFLLNAGACSSGPCAAAVSALAALVKSQNYDGLNIDFELLKNGAKPGLVAFMRQLYARTRAMGKHLTIDIIPAGSRRHTGAYNFRALAQSSDSVVLMTYDAHDNTSAPGPIAPLSWVRDRVNVAMQLGVAPSKLILGLADYGYDWPGTGRGHTVSLKQVATLSQQFGVKVTRTQGEPHFTYVQGGVRHSVWYEDGPAMMSKVRLAQQMHLSGLALWVAGEETAAYWHDLRQAIASPAAGSGVGRSVASMASSSTASVASSSGSSGSSSS